MITADAGSAKGAEGDKEHKGFEEIMKHATSIFAIFVNYAPSAIPRSGEKRPVNYAPSAIPRSGEKRPVNYAPSAIPAKR